MKPSRIFALIVVALVALPVMAEQTATESTERNADAVEPNIAETIRRGKMLYDFDQAAWHSTDALAAKAGDMAKLKLAGRVVVPVEAGLQAIYYGRNDAGRYAIFTGIWNGTKIVDSIYSKGETGPALSAEANAYADIIEMLMAGKLETKDLWYCNKARPNFALLPGEESGTFYLYFMTAQQKNNIYPLGGHHRLTIRDGKVVAQRKFTNSCIDLGGGEAAGQSPSMFYLTHMLDDNPTEIHVFTAIASRTAVVVGTTENKQTWFVTPKGNSASIENDKDVND
jgi:hypothetical protein